MEIDKAFTNRDDRDQASAVAAALGRSRDRDLESLLHLLAMTELSALCLFAKLSAAIFLSAPWHPAESSENSDDCERDH